jgi:hypothetical protein
VGIGNPDSITPRRHAVTEVVAPSPQHRVEPVEQVGERSMLLSRVNDRTLPITEANAFFDG